jgi:capsular polysaccharide biosynthesis protein
VFGPEATVIAHDDTVFGDLLNYWPKTYPYHDVLRQIRLPAPTRVEGRVAVLGARHSDNYHHFLLDVMPRLRLLGDQLRPDDRIVVHASLRFQRECLEVAGISLDRVIEPHPRLHLVADELLVPSLVPRISEHTVPYVQSLFREQRPKERPFRRLYLTRASAQRRRVANEAQLVAVLARLGFETLDTGGLSVREQARIFSQAEVIIGPDGGALTNVIFSQPEVRLVELFDSNYIIVGFWELVARVPGTYHMLVSPSPPVRSQWRDITVSVEQVRDLLAEIGIA